MEENCHYFRNYVPEKNEHELIYTELYQKYEKYKSMPLSAPVFDNFLPGQTYRPIR
jgi:hypothetical protein